MRIRIALPEDAPAIARGEANTAQTPGLLVGRPGEIPVDSYVALIGELRSAGRYLVADDNGTILGHAFLAPMPMEANAHVFRLTIVVYPGAQDRGVGRTLLIDLLDWAAGDPRVGKVELLVRATNERALRLYRTLGFVEEGRFRRRVRLPDSTEIDDISMAWFPPRTDAPDR